MKADRDLQHQLRTTRVWYLKTARSDPGTAAAVRRVALKVAAAIVRLPCDVLDDEVDDLSDLDDAHTVVVLAAIEQERLYRRLDRARPPAREGLALGPREL